MAFAANGMSVTGCFTHKETARPFEFAKVLDVFTVTEKTGKVHLFPHVVYVGPEGKETRMARVLKTVAYVIVDETADGKMVVEKWPIKRYTTYR